MAAGLIFAFNVTVWGNNGRTQKEGLMISWQEKPKRKSTKRKQIKEAGN
jgi:hypothetical protein